MKVLLTGAFGNIGSHTIEQLFKRNQQVRCFDIKTRANEKIANKYKDKVEVVWGDLRCYDDIERAVRDQEIVIHLGFVIPRLSATGVNSEDRPDWAREINIGGTRNLLKAMRVYEESPKIIFASSLHVFGQTQNQAPPREITDPVQPVEHYAYHKVACERMVKKSGLKWSIFRLPATLPIRLILDPGMFDVPLDNRIEYAHGRDVGTAFANAIDNEDIWGKTFLIGGGSRGQFYYKDLLKRVLDGVGVGMLPERAFSTIPYSTDWLDTSESQRLLNYQRHTLDDYVGEVKSLLGFRRHFVGILRPFIRIWMMSKSPYTTAW